MTDVMKMYVGKNCVMSFLYNIGRYSLKIAKDFVHNKYIVIHPRDKFIAMCFVYPLKGHIGYMD